MPLPNFLIIGPPKTGSTSLNHYLRQHPKIFMSPVKEPGFFMLEGDPPVKSPYKNRYYTFTRFEDYQALFAGVRDETAIGEASTRYFYSLKAAEGIRQRMPAAKLVTVLRNPIDRAFSEYLMLSLNKTEPLKTFEAVVERDLARLDDLDSVETGKAYVRGGFYLHFLQYYFSRFPREQIKVIFFDDLRDRPDQVLEDLFNFLGVPPVAIKDQGIYNKSGVPRSELLHTLFFRPNPLKDTVKSLVPGFLRRMVRKNLRNSNLVKPRLSPETRKRLAEVYRDEVEGLGKFFQRDLSHWLAG